MTEPVPEPPQRPSLVRELISLAKLVLGIGLILFACWRVYVVAFGPDESLLMASRIKNRVAADEEKAKKNHDEREIRSAERAKRSAADKAKERERLDRELTDQLNELPEKEKNGYRTERWMEIFYVVVSMLFGPGLLWSGIKGVRWPRKVTTNDDRPN